MFFKWNFKRSDLDARDVIFRKICGVIMLFFLLQINLIFWGSFQYCTWSPKWRGDTCLTALPKTTLWMTRSFESTWRAFNLFALRFVQEAIHIAEEDLGGEWKQLYSLPFCLYFEVCCFKFYNSFCNPLRQKSFDMLIQWEHIVFSLIEHESQPNADIALVFNLCPTST